MSTLIGLFLLSQYAFPFLTLYPGAEPTGMGGAFCGIADNSFACYYNPAGLAFQRGLDASFDYKALPWLVNARHWSAAATVPLYKNLSLGIFSTGVDYGKTEIANERGEYLGTYAFYDLAAGVSFGCNLFEILGAGVNVKYIKSGFIIDWARQPPDLFYGWTVTTLAADAGLSARHSFPFGRFGVGIAVQNVGPSVNYTSGDSRDPLPLNIRAGISYILTAKELTAQPSGGWLVDWLLERWRVAIVYDANKILHDNEFWYYLSHSIGFEIRPVPILAFRLGYFCAPTRIRENWREGATIGLGIDLKFVRIDLANDAPLHYFTSESARFSISLNIGEPILGGREIIPGIKNRN